MKYPVVFASCCVKKVVFPKFQSSRNQYICLTAYPLEHWQTLKSLMILGACFLIRHRGQSQVSTVGKSLPKQVFSKSKKATVWEITHDGGYSQRLLQIFVPYGQLQAASGHRGGAGLQHSWGRNNRILGQAQDLFRGTVVKGETHSLLFNSSNEISTKRCERSRHHFGLSWLE